MDAVRVDRVGASDGRDLTRLFEILASDAEAVRFFHPHPLTPAYAAWLCNPPRPHKDRYWLSRSAGRPVAYSMLRGWDEGFEVPSFGVCVGKEARGAGLGSVLLAHAAAEAQAAGARRLRLTVHRANHAAVHLYTRFGFRFEDKNPQEMVGWLTLAAG